MDLFTSFEGRISRKGFWLGFLGTLAVSLVAGLGMTSFLPSGIVTKIAQLIVGAGILAIWSAILVKRLHDRGKPALPLVAIFLAPSILMQILSIFQIGYMTVEVAGTVTTLPGPTATAVIWVTLAVSMWVCVELGFFKGTPGDNAYGPDPLKETSAAQVG